MAQGNPWFWGEHTSRWSFERELVTTAVHLRDKNAKVHVPKVSIEEVRARKNALAAKGILAISSRPIEQTIAAPRKIK